MRLFSPARRARAPLTGWLAAGLVVAASAAIAADPAPSPDIVPSAMSGGATTRASTNKFAYALSAANLPAAEARPFFFGNRLFNTRWIAAPASVASFDGLGPAFNRNSCSGCHVRDGRGRPPAAVDAPMLSMLIRLSVPGAGPHGGPRPHPAYGDQLNDRAILGAKAEGSVRITYRAEPGRYGDGTAYTLMRPSYVFRDLAFGPLGKIGADSLISPRTAPAVFGLGLLEAVAESDILALADPDDRDGDGVSGRPNFVWDGAADQRRLGRFGWKANQPSLRQQIAGAALGDIGITTSLFPTENCPTAQVDCLARPHGGAPEMSDGYLDSLEFYMRALAVPARRDIDAPNIRQGGALFIAAGCGTCHLPAMRTAKDAPLAILADQPIQPFTDLLLHDMGPDLADGRPDFEATGREWRTPPLWGIGLMRTVNGHTRLLHDGRARDLAEAILWHGGEGETSREAFRTMPAADRAALIAFLNSL